MHVQGMLVKRLRSLNDANIPVQTLHHRIIPDSEHVSVVACTPVAEESLTPYYFTSRRPAAICG
jgi:hypothetical protein